MEEGCTAIPPPRTPTVETELALVQSWVGNCHLAEFLAKRELNPSLYMLKCFESKAPNSLPTAPLQVRAEGDAELH